MELPKRKKKNLTKFYSLTMTPEMKSKLEELKEFRDIDVPNWIRSMIEKGLSDLENVRD